MVFFRLGRFFQLPLNPLSIGLGKDHGFFKGNTIRNRHPDTLERPNGNINPLGPAAALKEDVVDLPDLKKAGHGILF